MDLLKEIEEITIEISNKDKLVLKDYVRDATEDELFQCVEDTSETINLLCKMVKRIASKLKDSDIQKNILIRQLNRTKK